MNRHRFDDEWRKSRLAARLLIQKVERGPLSPRRQALAESLSAERGVTNRLIKHALLGFYGKRRHSVPVD